MIVVVVATIDGGVNWLNACENSAITAMVDQWSHTKDGRSGMQ